MKKTTVIYKSKYGSAKQYAEWISHDLEAELIEVKNVKANTLKEYDTIIHVGGIYAGAVNGAHVFSDNWEIIKNKNLICVTVGLTSNEQMLEKNDIRGFSEDMKNRIRFFHARGEMDYNKLNFFHKLIMKMVVKTFKKEKNPTPATRTQIDNFSKSISYIDKINIRPIIEYIKAL